MKTLILATDFSEGASWAEDYALEPAKHFHLRLVIFHVHPTLTSCSIQLRKPCLMHRKRGRH